MSSCSVMHALVLALNHTTCIHELHVVAVGVETPRCQSGVT